MEEDFERLLEEVDEIGNEGLVEGYITKKAVVKLLEDQWSKYQFLCKEKDAEVQHWIRKHKQDTQNFQSILEEQERAEVGCPYALEMFFKILTMEIVWNLVGSSMEIQFS